MEKNMDILDTATQLWLALLAFASLCGSNLGIGLSPGQVTGNETSTAAAAQFIEEPYDAYVFKNSPATLICEAQFVAKLGFNCSGGFTPNEVHIQQDVENVITLSTDVYRHMIKSLGHVTCSCLATTSNGSVLKSRTATLTLAYLRDNIAISPSRGARVHKNRTVTLTCHSPKGFPHPSVDWFKDGRLLSIKHNDRIEIRREANSSTLVIRRVQSSGDGLFSCMAYNLVGMKESKTIQVTVYVDGGWSDWFEFSNCTAKCGNGTKMLQRSCSNPVPENGGQFCMGRRIKVVPCQVICQDVEIHCAEDMMVPVNGSNVAYVNVSWNQPHVVNNKNGTKVSLRVVPPEAKSPMRLHVSQKPFVVKYIATHEHGQVSNCSMKITMFNASGKAICTTCKTESEEETDIPAGRGPSAGSSSSRVAIILGSVIAVCIIVSLALYRGLNRRHRGSESRKHLATSKTVDGAALQVDSTSLLITRSGSYEEAMVGFREPKSPPPPDTVTIDLQTLHSVSKEPSKQTASQIREEGRMYDRSNSCVSNKSTVSEISRVMWNVSNIPENADPKLMAWGLIDHNGGKLAIGNTGVTLTVPAMAIPKGHTEGIYIALMKQDGPQPDLTSKQSMLSPVVMCGPNGLKFNRPVILSLPHCALLEEGAWDLKVQYNENEPSTAPEWKQLVDVNKQDGTDSSFVIMEPNTCHLMVDHFTDFVLTGESAPDRQAVRMVQIVAYVTPPEVNKDCVVRVYCVADTPAAIESVHNQEIEKFGGETIDAPKPLFFSDSGGNLLVKILDHQDGWENMSGEEKKIRFLHVWNGIERMPSCTFVFSSRDEGVAQFRGRFDVRQDCDDGDEQEVNVVVTVKKGDHDKSTSSTEATQEHNANLNCACTLSASLRKAASVASLENTSAGSLTAGSVCGLSTRRSFLHLDTEGACAAATRDPGSPGVSPIDLKHLSFSSGYSSNGCQSLLSVHSLSQELRNELVFTLDPSHEADWKLLAEKLGFESKHIRWLESRKDSPTETLLNWWELKRSRKFPLRRLAEILREMGRDDAASLIEVQLPRETVV